MNTFRKSVILEIVIEIFLLTMTLEQGTCFRLYTCELLFVSLFFFPECSGILEDHTDPQMSCGDEIGPFYPNFPISAAHSGPVLS